MCNRMHVPDMAKPKKDWKLNTKSLQLINKVNMSVRKWKESL